MPRRAIPLNKFQPNNIGVLIPMTQETCAYMCNKSNGLNNEDNATSTTVRVSTMLRNEYFSFQKTHKIYVDSTFVLFHSLPIARTESKAQSLVAILKLLKSG